MGRHAKPKTTNSTKKFAVGASVILGGSVVPVSLAGSANAATIDEWDRVARCESNGQWNLPGGDRDSTGGLQFRVASWQTALDYLRKQGINTSSYPSMAYQATKEQQIMAGEALLALQGPRAWSVTFNGGGHCGNAAGGALSSGSMFKGGPKPFGSTPPVAPTPKPTQTNDVGAEVLSLVNAERSRAGLPALAADATLYAYARDWSAKMASERRMYHSGLNFPGSPRGENVATGYRSATTVMTAWMNSPDHRKNILGRSYTKLGVGMVRGSDGRQYWTQVFAGGRASAPVSTPSKPTSKAKTHTVVRGEWLAKIARHLKVEGGWKNLYAVNKRVVGSNPNLIYPGQVLKITGGAATPTPPARVTPPPPAPVRVTPKPVSSGYVMPVVGRIGDGLIISGSCVSRSCGGHSGLDISAPQGTSVVSVTAGVVVGINGAGAAYGNHVIIKHADGIYTLYAHLSANSVSMGQRVATGQRIGYVGSTGASSGPHLHFEVRNQATAFHAGVFSNPVPWLRSHGVRI